MQVVGRQRVGKHVPCHCASFCVRRYDRLGRDVVVKQIRLDFQLVLPVVMSLQVNLDNIRPAVISKFIHAYLTRRFIIESHVDSRGSAAYPVVYERVFLHDYVGIIGARYIEWGSFDVTVRIVTYNTRFMAIVVMIYLQRFLWQVGERVIFHEQVRFVRINLYRRPIPIILESVSMNSRNVWVASGKIYCAVISLEQIILYCDAAPFPSTVDFKRYIRIVDESAVGHSQLCDVTSSNAVGVAADIAVHETESGL